MSETDRSIFTGRPARRWLGHGALVVGVTTFVVTTATTATSFDVGDGADVDRWGAGVLVAGGTASEPAGFTDNSLQFQTGGAGDVVLTANGGNFDGTGDVRVTLAYITLTAPTS